jgi:hypothetical protein
MDFCYNYLLWTSATTICYGLLLQLSVTEFCYRLLYGLSVTDICREGPQLTQYGILLWTIDEAESQDSTNYRRLLQTDFTDKYNRHSLQTSVTHVRHRFMV